MFVKTEVASTFEISPILELIFKMGLSKFVYIAGKPEVPEAEWEIMLTGGLRAKVPSLEGLSEVDLHFNINKPLSGVSGLKYLYTFTKLLELSQNLISLNG